ncbi:MAG: GTPase Era [Candidatus Berkiella sp.]
MSTDIMLDKDEDKAETLMMPIKLPNLLEQYEKMDSAVTYCGFIAVMGRPNVGKSTLLNSMLNKKVSITSHKPQTTRCQILGVKTVGNRQIVWIDTPGIHITEKKAINRYMNQSARKALIDVNAVVFVVEAMKWTFEDEKVWSLLSKQAVPIIIVVNKIDKIKSKEELLPYLEMLKEKAPQAEIIPISALTHKQLNFLEKSIDEKLPQDHFYFPEDMSSNLSNSFHMAELIRERLMTYLEKEIPYSLAVQIEHCEVKQNTTHIHALIWVEREAQKHIVIGKDGAMLKQIGTKARLELEKFLDKKVCLKLWVKVKANWTTQADLLQNLIGYGDDN